MGFWLSVIYFFCVFWMFSYMWGLVLWEGSDFSFVCGGVGDGMCIYGVGSGKGVELGFLDIRV